MRKHLIASTLLLTSFLSSQAFACESDSMLMTENGFVFKVVAGSDKIAAFSDESASEEAYQLELLQPYFVICDAGEFFKITDIQTDLVDEALSGNVGFVAEDQVHPWTTREALSFSEIAFLEERPEIVAWDDEAVLAKFFETGNRKLHPPAFKENLEATRLRERATRPYPVMASQTRSLRGLADKRVYEVLLPAAITPKTVFEFDKEDLDLVQETLTTASLLVVFDATASMEKFALAAAKSVRDAISSLPVEVREGSEMGFVFFRDEGDTEKLVDVKGLPLNEASEALEKAAALMDGGGDIPEPILDALYHAANIYDWGQSGRKIVIAVLNEDAKPKTTGGLDDKGRVPAGLDVFAIARDFYVQDISVITVQAGPGEGPNFSAVMTALAEETGGEFIRWNAGGVAKDVAGALTTTMTTRAEEAIDEGNRTLSKLEYDLNGFPSIPLEVLDGAMLEALRAAGVDFNISNEEGGVLIREGFIVENDDLLAPEIQIDKDTLLQLINLYAIISTTGLDEEAMRRAISEAIAAIAGEDFDPDDTIEEIVEKKLGIQFRSDLLAFDINYIPAMLPAERLKFTARVQDSVDKLSQYLEANQYEFDTQVAVWMPVAVLP